MVDRTHRSEQGAANRQRTGRHPHDPHGRRLAGNVIAAGDGAAHTKDEWLRDKAGDFEVVDGVWRGKERVFARCVVDARI